MRLKLVESTSAQFEFLCNLPSGFGCLSRGIFEQVSRLPMDGCCQLAGSLHSSATKMKAKVWKLIEVAICVRMFCSDDQISPLNTVSVADFAARLTEALTSAAIVAGKTWDDSSSER
jgi:hypothetical protein